MPDCLAHVSHTCALQTRVCKSVHQEIGALGNAWRMPGEPDPGAGAVCLQKETPVLYFLQGPLPFLLPPQAQLSPLSLQPLGTLSCQVLHESPYSAATGARLCFWCSLYETLPTELGQPASVPTSLSGYKVGCPAQAGWGWACPVLGCDEYQGPAAQRSCLSGN